MDNYILLVDMNSFFASCHQSISPELRDKAIIICGSPKKRRGMVIAASYEAKAKGIYTTMSYYEAKMKCPKAIFIEPIHSLYSEFSSKIMDFLRLVGDCEVASIDEAYINIEEQIKKGFSPKEIAQFIRHSLWEEYHIPCSIGAGPNRIIAKMCADVKKPKGYTEMNREEFCLYFHSKGIEKLHGCGKKTTELLIQKGILTIGDLARTSLTTLKKWLGKRGEELFYASQGFSSEHVNAEREKGEKSIGKEMTFSEDVEDPNIIWNTTKYLASLLSEKLQEKGKQAKTVSIVYKTEFGASHSKSLTLAFPTDKPDKIVEHAFYLYKKFLWEIPLRLYGVRVSNFEHVKYEQLTIFDF